MNGSLRALAAGLLWLAFHTIAWATDKPHLVVFLSDDHGYLDSSAAGATDVATPHMERLMREGMTFTHAFAASPSCAPSRAALLTGLAPLGNGSMFNHQPPRADVKKLPAYLHELGYEVVSFGKVAHYKQGKDYGFDLVMHDTFHEDECVYAAVQWLQERESDWPLCLMIGTNWPHVPWPEADASINPSELTLPPTHVDTRRTRAERARYYAAIRRMDDELGQVYDAAYNKLGPDTLFLHFSDHGAAVAVGKVESLRRRFARADARDVARRHPAGEPLRGADVAARRVADAHRSRGRRRPAGTCGPIASSVDERARKLTDEERVAVCHAQRRRPDERIPNAVRAHGLVEVHPQLDAGGGVRDAHHARRGRRRAELLAVMGAAGGNRSGGRGDRRALSAAAG